MLPARHQRAFVDGYIDAACWTEGVDRDNLTESDLYVLTQHAQRFSDTYCHSLTAAATQRRSARYHPARQPPTWEDLGHDLWLTRNGHGEGYWSRGITHHIHLSNAARALGEHHLETTT